MQYKLLCHAMVINSIILLTAACFPRLCGAYCFHRPAPKLRYLVSPGYYHQYRHRHIISTQPLQTSLTGTFTRKALSSDTHSEIDLNMPRGVKKENLPTKVCVVCERPFTWRKKWERVWDEVTTCSKSCNKKRKSKTTGPNNNAELDVDLDPLVADFSSIHVCDSLGSDAEEKADVGNHEQIPTEQVEGAADIPQNHCDDESLSSQISLTFPDGFDVNEQFTPDSIPAVTDAKAQRKAEKKRKKAERRAQREGRGDPTAGQKQCTLCSKSVNLLIRCTHDKSGEWGMVCGKCWNEVSGGVPDGDDAHPHYRYGGLWKNRRAQT